MGAESIEAMVEHSMANSHIIFCYRVQIGLQQSGQYSNGCVDLFTRIPPVRSQCQVVRGLKSGMDGATVEFWKRFTYHIDRSDRIRTSIYIYSTSDKSMRNRPNMITHIEQML
ncbi:unnamed protein product [Periconia digitata]|uniref:Uncharacterized protein n=1 Tax=Periconia digitata TaxID=1303443 RepID=A0A9W4UQD1_9PLEO|nr:unnamed protein product [Periconia digitata]